MLVHSYSRASTLDAALSEHIANVPLAVEYIAGGTELIPLLKNGQRSASHLIDINALPWREIAEQQSCLRIGSLARLQNGRLLIGRGVASATYPAHRQPAAAYARLESDGTVVVQPATHDIGTGTYTVMTQVAAEVLGLPVDRIRFELGDSALPLSPRAAGSWTAASVSPAVSLATTALRRRIIDAACADDRSALHGVDPATIEIRDGWLRARHDPSSTDSYAAIALGEAAIVDANLGR